MRSMDSDPGAADQQPMSQRDTNDATAIDPVCGVHVKKATAQYTANYAGQRQPWRTFYFDSDECKQLFEREPERYANLPW